MKIFFSFTLLLFCQLSYGYSSHKATSSSERTTLNFDSSILYELLDDLEDLKKDGLTYSNTKKCIQAVLDDSEDGLSNCDVVSIDQLSSKNPMQVARGGSDAGGGGD